MEEVIILDWKLGAEAKKDLIKLVGVYLDKIENNRKTEESD